MFVGAGPYQVKGIEKAKEMGMFVVATDGNPEAPGLEVSDLSYVVDVKDIDANLEIARKNSVDGVLSVASEVSIRTVAVISQSLGLPGLEIDVAEKCTDKALMREAFFDSGVPSPKSYAVCDYQELLSKKEEIGLPVVIKPADNAGSRGVRLVEELDELKFAYDKALEYSEKGKVLIEEYMDGVEVSVEAFMYEGIMHVIALSDKVRTDPPYLLDKEVIFPSTYNYEVKKQIIREAEKAIKAVGIKMGPVHMELMITKDGPVPVELAARGPGFKVFTDIMPTITGIDLLKELILISLGQRPNLMKTRNKASVIKFIDTKTGTLKKISGLEEAKKINGIYELELYVEEGDSVHILTCGADRVGHIISIADSRKEAEKIVEAAESLLRLDVV